jgi:hypothetical protein
MPLIGDAVRAFSWRMYVKFFILGSHGSWVMGVLTSVQSVVICGIDGSLALELFEPSLMLSQPWLVSLQGTVFVFWC